MFLSCIYLFSKKNQSTECFSDLNFTLVKMLILISFLITFEVNNICGNRGWKQIIGWSLQSRVTCPKLCLMKLLPQSNCKGSKALSCETFRRFLGANLYFLDWNRCLNKRLKVLYVWAQISYPSLVAIQIIRDTFLHLNEPYSPWTIFFSFLISEFKPNLI